MSIEFVEDLKRQWMAMIDSIDDPLVIIDKEFNILRQNVAYARNSVRAGARSIRDFRGEKCYEVFAGRKSPCIHCKVPQAVDDMGTVAWATRDLFNGHDYEIRAHVLLPAEEDLAASPSELVQTVTRFAEGARIVVHYRDLTEQRLLQERLAQNDKLAALGKLAGGVAHEINSPLAGILAFSQMALKEMSPEDPHREDMVQIEDAARKCKVIVEGLLGFARQGHTSDIGEVNLFEIMQATLRLANPLIRKSGITLDTALPEEKGLALVNSGKMGQVFLNLVTNAIHAMSGGDGVLTVDGCLEGDSIQISVRDTGIGIEPENLKKIFDPFFTTKPVGEGTGLGLSISYSIVKQYEGEIRVSSTPGVGSCFTVVLPRASTGKILRAGKSK